MDEVANIQGRKETRLDEVSKQKDMLKRQWTTISDS